MTDQNSSGDTIEAQRRRRSDGPEGRAQAPVRRQEGGDSGGTGGRSGGTRGTSSGGKGGGIQLPWWAILLLVVLYFGYTWLFDDGGTQTEPQDLVEPTLAAQVVRETTRPAASSTPAPSLTPKPVSAGTSGKTWTVMLYEDADDQVLEEDMLLDINEAERVGSSDRVKIVAQVDRYRGGYNGDGNWVTARRYFINRDNDLSRINSQMVADLGEVNMSDSRTLIDFVTWAMKAYPADRYALILSDHGMGWPGGWSDESADAKKSDIPLVSAAGNQMYLMEIDQALGDIRKQTGLEKFEFIGMDACLMADLAVFNALAPHARYAVASQEIEPALGWAYTGFLKSLASNPDASGAELGQMVVKSYIVDDQRIVDDQARADFLRKGSPMGGMFGSSSVSSGQLANEIGSNITLTTVDLNAVSGVNDSLNKFVYALQKENQSTIAKARSYAQSYTSVFGDKVPASYIDLGNFSKIVAQESSKAEIRNAAAQLQAALAKFVIAEKHGPDKPGSTGVSIYFPNSKLYNTPAAGPRSYTAIANRFSHLSLWDDFLAFHYANRPFEPAAAEAVIPGANTRAQVPGQGTIEISQLKLSSKEAEPNKPVTIQAELRGKNIGYVYLFVGYMDTKSKSIQVTDYDFLESPTTRQIDGIYYPQWSDNEAFNLKFVWNPTVFAITDGKKTVTALFKPESFGAKAEDAVYSVVGNYQTADGSDTRFARLYFQDKQLRQVLGFTGEDQNGAPHEIIPQKGDTFTILEKWLDTDSSGKVTEVFQQGETLTFGDTMFSWKELFAAAGNYVVGFVVTDLEGNSQEAYQTVLVR